MITIKMVKCLVLLLVLSLTIISADVTEQSCSKAFGCSDRSILGKEPRYILYDVNIGEGFNLKRDVYMRMAMFVRALSKKSSDDWHLVLPPWTKQWHWTTEKQSVSYQWHNFFDVVSLQLYSPVIELDQFFADYGDTVNEVFVLQHFPEFYEWKGDSSGMDWSERWNYTGCRDHEYWKQSDGTNRLFRGKNHVKADRVRCISFHGSSGFLESVVSSTKARAVMFDRAEIATHMTYGDSEYWMCRRSMRFAARLVNAAGIFRASYLNSSDEQDGTVRPLDWRAEVDKRLAKGGPYLGVHLRRQDFIYGRPNEVPSLAETVAQIKMFLTQINLTTVFVATDMSSDEYEYLSQSLEKDDFTSVKYDTTDEEKNQLTEGGLAIIDQIIASHALFFVGTHESTFTYRIQEEREIMGFPVSTTFNRFCRSSTSKHCTPPTKWLIKYPLTDSDHPMQRKPNHIEVDEL